ncbi:MAG: hypothetical protein JXQ68_08090 [Campylobacterales bacterium]|nr:hypothetical protein [Campylobacterales bacterium]
MEDVLIYIFFLILFELFEISWQYSKTLYGVLEKANGYYQKSIFILLLMHPSFYYVLFVVLATGKLNLTMIIIIAFKIFDIFMKIELVRQLFIKREISAEMESLLHTPISSSIFFIGIILYVPLLYIALM